MKVATLEAKQKSKFKEKESEKLYGKRWAGNCSRLAAEMCSSRSLRRTPPNAITHRIINGEDLTKREIEGNGWFGSWKSPPPLYVSRHVKARIVTTEKLRTDSKKELQYSHRSWVLTVGCIKGKQSIGRKLAGILYRVLTENGDKW